MAVAVEEPVAVVVMVVELAVAVVDFEEVGFAVGLEETVDALARLLFRDFPAASTHASLDA